MQDTADWTKPGSPAQGLCGGRSCLYFKLMDTGSYPLRATLWSANIKLEQETLGLALASTDLTADQSQCTMFRADLRTSFAPFKTLQHAKHYM